MLSGGECELNEWGVDVESGYSEWQDVDRELRSIARRPIEGPAPQGTHVGAIEAAAPRLSDVDALPAPVSANAVSGPGAGSALRGAHVGANDAAAPDAVVAPSCRPSHAIAKHVPAPRNGKPSRLPSMPASPRREATGEDPRELACCALRTLGWKPRIAEAAVEVALAELGPSVALEPLVVSAPADAANDGGMPSGLALRTVATPLRRAHVGA